ncbi:hypothetical protein [Streptomyces sp. NPDC001665]
MPGALTVAGVAVLSAVYAWGWSRTYETIHLVLAAAVTALAFRVLRRYHA